MLVIFPHFPTPLFSAFLWHFVNGFATVFDLESLIREVKIHIEMLFEKYHWIWKSWVYSILFKSTSLPLKKIIYSANLFKVLRSRANKNATSGFSLLFALVLNVFVINRGVIQVCYAPNRNWHAKYIPLFVVNLCHQGTDVCSQHTWSMQSVKW